MNADDSSPPSASPDPDAGAKEIRQRLEHLFRRCDTQGDRVVRELFNVLLEHRLEAPR